MVKYHKFKQFDLGSWGIYTPAPVSSWLRAAPWGRSFEAPPDERQAKCPKPLMEEVQTLAAGSEPGCIQRVRPQGHVSPHPSLFLTS